MRRLLANERATPTSRMIRVSLENGPFPYRAGQSARLGIAGVALTPYSIASAPCETSRHGWLEFLVKVDGSSRFGAVVDELPPGTPLVLSAPDGAFVLPDGPQAGHFLFVAGGTGIAPLRSMIRELVGTSVQARIDLLYAARSPEEFAYLDELKTLAREGRLSLALTLTGAADDWAHARGRPGEDHLRALVTPDTLAFLCGPRGMVDDVTAALRSIGLPGEWIRSEQW